MLIINRCVCLGTDLFNHSKGLGRTYQVKRRHRKRNKKEGNKRWGGNRKKKKGKKEGKKKEKGQVNKTSDTSLFSLLRKGEGRGEEDRMKNRNRKESERK